MTHICLHAAQCSAQQISITQSEFSCITDRRLCCSLSEADLWDYIITNDTMESTGKQLDDISGRALAGQIGNGIAALQEPELTASPPAQTVMALRNMTAKCHVTCSRVCIIELTDCTAHAQDMHDLLTAHAHCWHAAECIAPLTDASRAFTLTSAMSCAFDKLTSSMRDLQGPAATQQRTAAAEAASGGPIVAPAAAVAPVATSDKAASKETVSSPTATSVTTLPPVPTVPTAAGFERSQHCLLSCADISLLFLSTLCRSICKHALCCCKLGSSWLTSCCHEQYCATFGS